MQSSGATLSSQVDHDLIQPFRLNVLQSALDDLKSRLARTRWPDELPGTGADYGAALTFVRETAEYWRTDFDWRVQEARINAVPQCMTTIDGQAVHFFHARSSEPGALPIILTHGWPSSSVEFLDFDRPADGAAALWRRRGRCNRDLFLTHVTLYWLTRTAASSSRVYYEDAKAGTGYRQVKNSTPTGVAVFPGNFRSIRRLAERTNNIVHWSQFDRGGHFAAMDAPDPLIDDLRAFFRRFR